MNILTMFTFGLEEAYANIFKSKIFINSDQLGEKIYSVCSRQRRLV